MFDGQQSGERILHTIHPHPLSKNINYLKIIILGIFFAYFIFSIVGNIGVAVVLFFLCVSLWWNHKVYTRDITYITDRRIIRFDQVSPFIRTKRELFWQEALKAKGYAPNLFYRANNIGTLEVNPVMGDSENVRITDVYYFEDVANYIDKILFTIKNQPQEIQTIKPFVSKPKGQRS